MYLYLSLKIINNREIINCYGLFDDAVSSSGYIISNDDSMINE
jgi:hypothetical protein